MKTKRARTGAPARRGHFRLVMSNYVIHSLAFAPPLTTAPHVNTTALHTRVGEQNGPQNPTHYGPPYGGQCREDEQFEYFWAPAPHDKVEVGRCEPDFICKQDSDCPTDKPPNTKAAVSCLPEGFCGLSCSSDDDCPLGGFCILKGGDAGCAFDPSTDCYYIKNVQGSWVARATSTGKQTVSVQTGITRSHEVSDTSDWGGSVTTTASAGFKFFGTDASVEVSGTASHSISHSYSSTFSESSSTTYTADMDAGVVWQWAFDIDDGCGSTTATGLDFALTINKANPPCCIPGYFLDPTKAHGDCVEGTANICTGVVEAGANTRP